MDDVRIFSHIFLYIYELSNFQFYFQCICVCLFCSLMHLTTGSDQAIRLCHINTLTRNNLCLILSLVFSVGVHTLLVLFFWRNNKNNPKKRLQEGGNCANDNASKPVNCLFTTFSLASRIANVVHLPNEQRRIWFWCEYASNPQPIHSGKRWNLRRQWKKDDTEKEKLPQYFFDKYLWLIECRVVECVRLRSFVSKSQNKKVNVFGVVQFSTVISFKYPKLYWISNSKRIFLSSVEICLRVSDDKIKEKETRV